MFVFTFPGQGSQKVGMGRALYDSFPTARDTFHEIDDTLNLHLSKIAFDGSEADLNQTMNTQPALFAVSAAIINVLQKEFSLNFCNHVRYLAGHSLGEYVAIFASGCLNLQDTIRLLRIRAQAMNDAAKKSAGAMYAVLGLDKKIVQETINAVSSETCSIANDNCPGQIVISGSELELAHIADQLTQNGAKRVVRLNVSGAFHSPLMSEASEILSESIDNFSFHNTTIPIITNVSAEPTTCPDSLKNHLKMQVCGQVRWTESMQYANRDMCSGFVEIGSGRVLSNLMSRINPEAKTINLELPQDIDNFMKSTI